MPAWRSSQPAARCKLSLIEAADWIVWQLTGEERRNTCTAGYKAMWVKGKGFPSPEFFRALHPNFGNVADKLATQYYSLGERAGGLTPAAALIPAR